MQKAYYYMSTNRILYYILDLLVHLIVEDATLLFSEAA